MNLLSVLGCIFIVLKLLEVIDWSWWLVLLPIYGGLLLFIVIFVGGIVIMKIKGEE